MGSGSNRICELLKLMRSVLPGRVILHFASRWFDIVLPQMYFLVSSFMPINSVLNFQVGIILKQIFTSPEGNTEITIRRELRHTKL